VKNTAQGYLNQVGINFDLQQVEKTIRDKPLGSAAIAAVAGFIVGGGTENPQHLGPAAGAEWIRTSGTTNAVWRLPMVLVDGLQDT
jgi:hypothetical protein